VPPAQRPTSPGAAHGSELNYVFNSLKPDASPEDHATAETMNAYWAAFAKYGEPGAAGGPAWPRWTPDKEAYIEFSASGPLIEDHLQSAGIDWAEAELKGDQIVRRTEF
jgi:para-nitrobenzyl esterase